ncbi:hypothetical protein KJ742_03340 [Patescibacteria group bacterium]|nr:hypothetical protein [Patescibacteria group bacterium]MBU1682954.1 hypothetical protein [Patescibacteria group bacterium]
MPETEKIREKIDPLKLDYINGIRAKINALIKKAVMVGGAGLLVGTIAGTAAQKEYRDWVGDDYEDTEQGGKGQQAPLNEQEPEYGILSEARRKVGAVKDAIAGKVGEEMENTETVQKIRELETAYHKLRETGDKASFWIPFLMAFLATVKLLNISIEAKKKLTENVDPQVEVNMKKIEEKLNELIKRMNDLSQKEQLSIEEQGSIRKEVDRLMEEMTQIKESLS